MTEENPVNSGYHWKALLATERELGTGSELRVGSKTGANQLSFVQNNSEYSFYTTESIVID